MQTGADSGRHMQTDADREIDQYRLRHTVADRERHRERERG